MRLPAGTRVLQRAGDPRRLRLERAIAQRGEPAAGSASPRRGDGRNGGLGAAPQDGRRLGLARRDLREPGREIHPQPPVERLGGAVRSTVSGSSGWLGIDLHHQRVVAGNDVVGALGHAHHLVVAVAVFRDVLQDRERVALPDVVVEVRDVRGQEDPAPLRRHLHRHQPVRVARQQVHGNAGRDLVRRRRDSGRARRSSAGSARRHGRARRGGAPPDSACSARWRRRPPCPGSGTRRSGTGRNCRRGHSADA